MPPVYLTGGAGTHFDKESQWSGKGSGSRINKELKRKKEEGIVSLDL
jgi:hypothetical protein